jgi:hypothetical protein
LFPFVSDTTKTTTYEDGIKFNNGVTVHIASYFNGYQRVENSEYEIWWTNTKGCNNVSDVFSLEGYSQSARILNGEDVEYVLNNMQTNKQPESYYLSEEYITKREVVEAGLTFVWGNIDEGGLACYRDSRYSNYLSFVMINGFYQWSDGQSLRYGYFTVTSAGIDTNFWDMSRIQFRYDAGAKLSRPNQFCAFMCYPSKTTADEVTIASLRFDAYRYSVLTALADFSQLADLPTDYYENDLSATGDPISCFYDPTEENKYLFDGSKSDTQLAQEGYEKLSGNPYADAEIDDS